MAKLDEPTDENKIENRSQNNRVFLCRIIYLTSHLMVWHNTREQFAHC